MIDFVEYVVSELKQKRLSKADALALIKQFSQRSAKGSVLHPLLHRNTSDLGRQSYASTFTGGEFFLRDHRVQQRLLLPGVAYLEMACAAVAEALPSRIDATVLELHDVVWAQPIEVSGPTEVTVALFASEDEGRLEYEICTRDGDEEIVHCRGEAVLTRQPAPAALDIELLKAQMDRGRIEASAVYAGFREVGIDHGPGLQSVSTIHKGDRQLLAELRLPDVVEAQRTEYRLHPSMMDGALQTLIGLAEDLSTASGQARLPFALECLRVVSACTPHMYAWVRYAPGSQPADKVVKLDIDVCDASGNVCVQLRGFSSRALGDERSSVLLAAPVWQASAIAAGETAYAEHHVILCELPEVDVERLGCHCLSLQAEGEKTLAQRYEEYALACFERLQAIVRARPQGKVLVQIVVADALFAGLTGLVKTATLENPQLAGQVILTEPGTTTEALAARLQEEKAGALEPLVRYTQGVRQVLRWEEVTADQGVPPIAFKEDGVYLITGGLGGLGTLFAEEILRQSAGATVVLTGRSRLEQPSRERVIYRQVDLGDAEQVDHLIAAILERYGRLTGILHCAGMIADNFILKKTSAEFRQVLEPKVAGTFNLDRSTRDVALDFFVLFSSVSATMGNTGQADYAAANAFMDQFAADRNREVAAGRRRGRTLSIDWPLWANGGMGVDESGRERLERTTGMQAMPDAAGMEAFHRSLALPHDQLLVAAGDLARLRRTLLAGPPVPARVQAEPPAPAAAIDAASVAEKTRDYLRRQCSDVLNLPPHRIDVQAPLEDYGIDSIMAMRLTERLEETFGALPKTLFFEYQTLAELAGYFVESHQARLAALFASPVQSAPPEPPAAGRRAKARRSTIQAAPKVDADRIAVIGMSGRYPEAIDLESYWRNLRDGKDCIIEVPRERWDWREYYTEDRTRSGYHYSKWGGFIAGVDEFDPLFFNISPVEAEILDPQERLFLQHAWAAIEDAGYTRATLQIPCGEDLAGQVGVYAGVMYGEYQLFGAEASMRGKRMGFANNPASIANRVSYVLNLHGPSMTLDTMCSSSLTAIHLACEDLRHGRTSLAIAGGVNVTIHPNKYLMVSAGQAISSDGHCQSFGEGGDGYIPAEGVGVVILKRLADAERDGDHIYGVIRGSALNHGGKTNGYTVPNPQAQATAITRALAESQTDPRHVSYMEAHGTGTKLGDPIEIAALTRAFRQSTPDTAFCLIGSAKSNIGHCESAAGVAGLTKVLLQMQHRQIAPSLHSARLNPHIDFDDTPFVVNQSLKSWEQPVIDGRTLPRIAGISSFGAGGSNAHMIVEEYQAPPSPAAAVTEAVIPLSARTAEQLRQKVRDLLAFVEPRLGTIDLAAMAYTLQVGREAMAERLAFVVTSAEQLAEKLRAWLDGSRGIEDAYEGQVRRNDGALSLLATDADLQQTIDRWIVQKKFSKLLDLWVTGLELDWNKLYGEVRPRRIPLPAYPFARERYWIDTTAAGPVTVTAAAVEVLHPLLQRNTSDLNGQRYSTTFTGEEFFLTDHQVSGQRVLPGVAYLEMARAAIEEASPERPEASILELHHTVWARPVVVSQNTRVEIALSQDDDRIDYEVYSEDGDHCQGSATFSRRPAPARLDLEQLEARMGRGRLEADSVYAACSRMGLAYGPSLRGVTAIHRGSGEVLARLRLPSPVAATAGDYVLHPSVMDSALQAAVGLMTDEATAPRLPFALETLRVLSPCRGEMLAWVRYAPGSDAKLDIDLCDERGEVCVQMHGLSSRVLSQQLARASLFATPVWQASAVEGAGRVEYAEHHVILCERSDLQTVAAQCLSLPADGQKNIAERYCEHALACFELVQTILRSNAEGKVLVQIVVADHEEQALFAGLSGLLRTAALENPRLTGQLILVPAGMSASELGRRLEEEKSRGVEPRVRYRQEAREVLRWEEIAPAAEAPPIAFKDRGVYLITGGRGGLGQLFAKAILDRAGEARVVLTGRAASSAEIQARLSYRQVDLADADQVEQLIAGIRNDYGRLDGILHCAGMTADNFILKKTRDEFARVLAPKAAGTFHLDRATRDVALDFFVLFSSISGAMGNPGQADYAAANAFMDEFAAYRNRQVAAGQRHGRTRSINWPLWQAGGMGIDETGRELLERATGVQPMQTTTGLEAFHRALALPHDQLLVAEGDLPRMRRALLAAPSAPSVPPFVPPVPSAEFDSPSLAEKTHDYLRKALADVLKLPAHKIDPHAPLENYGIDSVLAMKLTNQLEKTFGTLSKTLFFEYQTIAALAGFFLKAHPAVLQEALGLRDEPPKAKAIEPAQPAPRRRSRTRPSSPATSTRNDIAIVGLGGRYPQAGTLREFWRNLQAGRDCITEIPMERWDHGRYYDPNPDRLGTSYSKWGGFIADVDKFDPLFFNISPKEAALIDPQERLFLETAWETIEDAGYTKESISGRRVGVFVGVMWGQYDLLGVESLAQGNPGLPITSYASIANRVSYFFDLHGPSIALDTMCSSSLTAIHLACEQLRSGEIDAAIAGGVNVTIHPYKYLTLSQGRFAASDGRCRSFGEGGDGYVPGEGVGAVLLKRLEHAVRDGDQIYAVIRSSTINHGGKTNGYSVPNPNAQGDLIVEALRKAEIDPGTLSYIETHGTGTSLGDPIEITGLLKAFEGSTAEKQFCPIGSVKSNIGHLESAAGIASLTKALLQIRYGQLVPSLHAEPLNPHIDFESSPFYVQRELAEWKRPAGHPRRVGVSSFGAGGANAHLIVEEYDRAQSASRTDIPEVFVLSARTPAALRRYAARVVEFLESAPDVSLASIAYTAQTGRTAMDARLAIVTSSVADLRDKLNAWIGNASLDGVFHGNLREVPYGAGQWTDGPAGKVFLEALLHSRDLERIAGLWALGAEVDWSVLHRHGRPAKISLPTYPFERERCWVHQDVQPLPRVEARSADIVYYAPEWSRQPLGPRNEIGPVLILDDSDSLSAAIRERGASSVILVKPGQSFEEIVEDLDRKGMRPGVVLHHQSEGRDPEDGFYALFHLCRALMRGKHAAPLRILSAFSDPLGAAISGFLETLALEDPAYLGKAVEVEGAEKAALLWDELRERDWTAREIRYRGHERHVRGLVARPEPQNEQALPLRHNGVYLITGGLGGLGLIFAEYLAKSYQARLILVGRSAPNAAQREKLEALGSEVLVLQADVAKPEDTERVVREARARFSELHGVIHAAGVTRDAFILRKTKEEMEAVLASKVRGTINLDLATRDLSLDFFVLFSSVAGVMGNVGQCDYAFASRFQDAYAEHRETLRRGRSLSIDWPLWEEGGMRIPPGDVALLEKRTGMRPLPTADGIRCFEDFLRSDAVQGVAVYGVPARMAALIESRKAVEDRPSRLSGQAELPVLHSSTEAYLKAIIGEEIALDADRIGSSDPLESFGLDSVVINRINARLERDLGALPKTLLYQHETVGALAAWLVQEQRSALAGLFDVRVPEIVPAEPKRDPAPLPKEEAENLGDIAIIGVHGSYPHSPTADEFWSHLKEGRELIDLVPPDRWNCEELYDPDPAAAAEGKIYCKWGGFLDDYDKFDPRFFRISTADARIMDPQERLFLESVWAAIEDAGYTRDRLKTRHPKAGGADVGVFVGVTTNTYDLWSAEERLRGHFVTASAMPWSIANRVSYVFDFNGPSLPVDTACSSSLVAIHLACESLRSGGCQVAIAGGVNLYLHPAKYHSLCQSRMVSTDGKCHSYGAGDDGFVPGEGVGTLVLKPLARAIADQDRIYAVIRGSAWDHAGRSNGYSAPNPNSQASLIAGVLEKARVHPETIGYVEGHGTGTQLGDSIEIAALTEAFRSQTAKKQFCPIGSVKANVGHAESAAGIASLAKVLLQMEHGQLAPSIHSDTPNPNIDFAGSPFYLQHELSAWERSADHPRRALINSFGAGGVNACVVVEEYARPEASDLSSGGPYLFTLSAKSEDRLRAYADRVLARLQDGRPVDLASLCYTLQVGREAMEERLAIVAGDVDELVERLSEWRNHGSGAGVHRGSPGSRGGSRRSLKLVRTGLGEQSLSELASKWVAGEDVEWESLYAGGGPRRTGVPTYPFARERYWVSDSSASEGASLSTAQLHPLITCNSSTLTEVRFSSSLSDSAFYAVDHQVHEERIFPGAGFLEMACVAGTMAGEERVRKIKDVVWSRPLRFRKGGQTLRTLLRRAGDCAEYDIASFDDENQPILHSEGRLELGNGRAREADAERLSIRALKAQCARAEDGAAFYERFKQHGVQYGPSFQTVQEIHVSESFALSRLKIADHLKDGFGQFILHPSIIDGALQTAAGLVGGSEPAALHLPFALDELEIVKAVPQACYAYAERAGAGAQHEAGVTTFNIRLLSEGGEVLIRFTNLLVRSLAAAARTPVAAWPGAERLAIRRRAEAQ